MLRVLCFVLPSAKFNTIFYRLLLQEAIPPYFRLIVAGIYLGYYERTMSIDDVLQNDGLGLILLAHSTFIVSEFLKHVGIINVGLSFSFISRLHSLTKDVSARCLNVSLLGTRSRLSSGT